MDSLDRPKGLEELRVALADADGRKKLDLILDHENPAALIQHLPAEDLYFAIQEIGLHDARPLVQLATPEQFRTFVDLDAWDGYELDAEKVLLWLRLSRTDDDEAYFRKFRGLDVEVLEILLRGIVRIFDLEEDPEPTEDFEGSVETTMEGRFLLVYPPDKGQYAAAKRLIDDLYTEDPFMAGRFLYAVRWELQSELMETALKWRTARMADLGFPSLEEAMSLYAKVDLEAALPPPAGIPDQPQGFFLERRAAVNLFDRSMERVEGDRQEALKLELVALLNAALVADQVPPAEVEAVREVAEAVRDTLALGLEHLVGGSAEAGAEILSRSALKRIFQIGFTRTLELRWRADELRKKLPLSLEAGTFLPDAPLGERFAALMQRRPRYHQVPEGRRPERVRAFATLAELEETSEALDQIETAGAAFLAAGFDPAEAKEVVTQAWGQAGLARVRFGDLLLTAAARASVGLPPTFEALPASRLDEAARATFHPDGTLREEGRAALRSVLPGGDELEPFLAAAATRLEEELGEQVKASGLVGLSPDFAAPWIVGA